MDKNLPLNDFKQVYNSFKNIPFIKINIYLRKRLTEFVYMLNIKN